MSSKFGSLSKPDGNSKAYVNSSFWESLEKKKKAEAFEKGAKAELLDEPQDLYIADSLTIEQDGAIYTFGESTIEVEFIGDPDKSPFERVKGDEK